MVNPLPELLDAQAVADCLGIKLEALRRMAARREYPELLHVTRGVYRVRLVDHQAWLEGRWTLAEAASAQVKREAIRGVVVNRLSKRHVEAARRQA